MFGQELILDVHNCNAEKFTKEALEEYLATLCDLIDMKRAELHYWEGLEKYRNVKDPDPKMVGISLVQFITTSSIVIHTIDLMHKVYINIFSCKEFDQLTARIFTERFFEGVIMHTTSVGRR